MNSLLSEGLNPLVLKEAIVYFPPQKAVTKPNGIGQFESISNVPFLGEIVEKVVELGMKLIIWNNLQSGFRPGHSNETDGVCE